MRINHVFNIIINNVHSTKQLEKVIFIMLDSTSFLCIIIFAYLYLFPVVSSRSTLIQLHNENVLLERFYLIDVFIR